MRAARPAYPGLTQRRGLVRSRALRAGLGITLSGLALYLSARGVDYRSAWLALSQADLRLVGLALGGVLAANLAKAFRWQVLLHNQSRTPLPKLFLAHVAGQMFNAWLPMRVGDFGRAFLIERVGPGRGFVLGTIFLEKLLDLLVYISLVWLLLFLIPLPSWISGSAFPLVGLAILVFGLVAVLSRYGEALVAKLGFLARWLPALSQAKVRPALQAGLSSLAVLRSPAQLVKLACASALVWGLSVLINHWTLLALGIDLPLRAALLILIGLQVGVALPSVPGRIGVFEYLCVLALSFFGVQGPRSFSYAVLLHGIALLPIVLGGLLAVWVLGWQRRPSRILGRVDLLSRSRSKSTHTQISELAIHDDE